MAALANQRFNVILDFCYGTDRTSPQKSQALAAPRCKDLINIQFLPELIAAEKGELDEWMTDKFAALALIVLLDQFALLLHQDTPRGFEISSSLAIPLTKELARKQWDTQLPDVMRADCYLPLVRSENMEDQQLSLTLHSAFGSGIERAVEYRGIIVSFGRFPGRNALLGRNSTAAEEEYFRNGGVL